MTDLAKRLAENMAAVRERIGQAAVRSGRQVDEITLVAVTKYVRLEIARALVQAGCHHLGESRPQELWHKADALAGQHVAWHLVGHLQRNKIRRTLPLVSLIHSVDSLRLLAALDEEAKLLGCPVNVLLEVNCSGDAAKHGFQPSDMPELLQSAAELPLVTIRGLMTMAALEGDRDTARRNFADLRALRDRLTQQCPSNAELTELSMGMSGDFEVAIEEGATIVRIGSALFEGVEP